MVYIMELPPNVWKLPTKTQHNIQIEGNNAQNLVIEQIFWDILIEYVISRCFWKYLLNLRYIFEYFGFCRHFKGNFVRGNNDLKNIYSHYTHAVYLECVTTCVALSDPFV